MPTPYTTCTEMMVLQEYVKKVESEEGIDSFTKSEIPDGIIKTRQGRTIGAEVSSAIRTDDSAATYKEKNKMAMLQSKHGLYNPDMPPIATLSESFQQGEYVALLILKITERIQDKEANKGYFEFEKRFDKSVLLIYLDDLFITTDVLEIVASENSFSIPINTFDEVYLYVRTAIHTSLAGPKVIGGFHLIARKLKDSA